MTLFSGIDTELELAEAYALEMGEGYSSEEQLSEAFDEHIASNVIEKYGEDDEPAMNEAFNNWTDGLCKDGELHSSQYNNYTYVGKHSS